MKLIFLNRLISFLLALNMITAQATVTATNIISNNADIHIIQESLADNITYQAPREPEKAEAIPGLRWVDRIDWAGREYGLELYKALESAATNDGALIDVTKGTKYKDSYCIPITTIEGFSSSRAAAEEEIKQKTSIIGQYVAVAYTAFQRDHPEVFWLSGKSQYRIISTFTTAATGDTETCHYKTDVLFVLKSPTFDMRATKYKDIEEIKSTIEIRNKLVSDIIQAAPAQTRYQQLEYFNKYLVESNQYNTSYNLYSIPRDSRECIGALKGSSGLEGPVCEGYAHAFKVLCDQAGIPCVLVTGYGEKAFHIWNYVQMEDNKWYAVDVTWNDGPSSSQGPDLTKAWFLIGTDTKIGNKRFSETHRVSTERLGIEYKGGPELSIEAYQAQ